jgi:acyl dehydratase
VVAVGTGSRHELVAHNTATSSTNKIHDDAIARRYGFEGGLVPGVDVYAYMTRAPAEAWGLDWLRAGTMRARFLAPVYDGQTVIVLAGEATGSQSGLTMPVELRDGGGTICAAGEAGMPADEGDPPPVTAWRAVGPVDEPQDASPDSLAPGTALAGRPHRFRADQAGDYLAEVREVLPLYAESRVAHPGWLLRDANHVLTANVRLGPWIHVESRVRHHSIVRDGQSVEARAVVTKEWIHKGHRFVELDVGFVVDGDRVAARVTHTAIYRPRPPAPT